MNTLRTVRIVYSDEDEGYIGTIDGYNGLSAFGKTPAKMLKELDIARQGYLDIDLYEEHSHPTSSGYMCIPTK